MGNKVIVNNLVTRSGTNEANYLYGISAVRDESSVTKWYEFDEKLSLDEGQYYFFIKPKTGTGKTTIRLYNLTCNGAEAICEILFSEVSKGRVSPPCSFSFEGIVKANPSGICSISSLGIDKNKPSTDSSNSVPTAPLPTTGSGRLAMDSGKFADLVPFTNQVTSGDFERLENDFLIVEFAKDVGLCPTNLTLKSQGENLINTHRVTHNGKTVRDKGRSIQFASDYMFPRHGYITPGGDNTANHGYDTGNNDVPGGSLEPYSVPSKILASGYQEVSGRGMVFYAHVRPKIWGVPDEDSVHTFEMWCWLKDETLCYRILHHKNQMADAWQLRQRAATQENPCLFLRGGLWVHKMVVGKPWVNTPSIMTNPADFTPGTSPIYDRRKSSECWQGAYYPSGFGVTLFTPGNSAFTDSQVLQRSGDADSNECTYIAATPDIIYSTPGTYEQYGYIIVGTEQRARQIIYSLDRPGQDLNFDFSYNNQGWNSNNGDAFHNGSELIVDLVEWRAEGNFFYAGNRFMSPDRSWSGRLLQKLEITVKSTDVTSLDVIWDKPNQFGIDGYYQRKNFPVISDGKLNTYLVDMTGCFGLDETITAIGLGAKLDTDNVGPYTGHEQIRPKLIRAIYGN